MTDDETNSQITEKELQNSMSKKTYINYQNLTYHNFST